MAQEMRPSTTRVGLLGAGAMGTSLIVRLIANGFLVSVFDPSSSACKQAIAEGANAMASAEAVFASGGLIITCVASPHALAAVTDAALAAHKQGALFGPVIETSTLSYAVKDEARHRLAASEIVLLDCPVSGTSAQARKGDLVVFASGDELSLTACKPIFSAIAKSVVYAGGFGMGMRLKLLANHLVGAHSAVAAEVLMLARKSRLDPKIALRALIQSAGSSRMLEVRGPLMLNHEYLPATGSIDIIVKDGEMIKDMARQAECDLPLFDRAYDMFRGVQEQGRGNMDIASIYGFHDFSGAPTRSKS